MRKVVAKFAYVLLALPLLLQAEAAVELETTRIKGHEELPQILYIVPWRDLESGGSPQRFKLQLHDLFGDLYQPQIPDNPPGSNALSEQVDQGSS